MTKSNKAHEVKALTNEVLALANYIILNSLEQEIIMKSAIEILNEAIFLHIEKQINDLTNEDAEFIY